MLPLGFLVRFTIIVGFYVWVMGVVGCLSSCCLVGFRVYWICAVYLEFSRPFIWFLVWSVVCYSCGICLLLPCLRLVRVGGNGFTWCCWL